MISQPDYIPDLGRLKGLYVCIVLMLGIIVVRLWFLQIVKGKELRELSRTQRTRLIRRVAARGTILDSKGQELATNRPHFVVSVLPDELKRNPEILPRLSRLLKISEEELQAQIDLNRTTPFDPVPVADDVDTALLTQIEEQRLDLPGVFITQDPKRYYTDAQLCTHLLGIARPISPDSLAKLRDKGYRGGDYLGVEGLEAYYESVLRGKDGGQVIEVDARGRMKRSLEEIKPKPGHSLRLTIDRALQQTTYDALKEELDRGHPGAAVAIDPNDGAVLAFVSVPSYDLNRYGADFNLLDKNPDKPLFNRAFRAAYPCGSPFKLITAAAGMRTGTTSASTSDYCKGFIISGRRRFNCDVRSGHGSIGFKRAVAASCDVYFWHVAERAELENLIGTAKRFGLGEQPGIDLPAYRDARGRLPTPEWKTKTGRGHWLPGDLLNMAIGQGYVGVTPLQLANATAALANGGTLLRPQLVREEIDASGAKPYVVRRLKREEKGTLGLTWEQHQAIVEGMRGVVERGGTAAGLSLPGIEIAGKTGTAEVIIKGKDMNHSVFVCFAPADKPTIAVAVLVEGGGHGSDTAAPIARRILARHFNIEIAPRVARSRYRGTRD